MQTNVLYDGDNLDILRLAATTSSSATSRGNATDAQLLAFEDTWHRW